MKSEIGKKDNKYRYLTISDPIKGQKKIYLGTNDDPKIENIKEAINFFQSKIRFFENEVNELENLLISDEPEYNISYKIVFFDLDGVIFEKPWYEKNSDVVSISTWDMLFKELGPRIYGYHEELKHKFESGGFSSYLEWTETACQTLKPFLDKGTFERIINQRVYFPGAKKVFDVLHKNRTITAIISGSFDALAQRANIELGGIDYLLAHAKFIFNGNGLLNSWKLEQTDYSHKAEIINKITKERKIPLSDCAFIGDDVNDIYAFKEVGLSIAFNSNKQKVNEAAKVIIEGRNLQLILPHLCKK